MSLLYIDQNVNCGNQTFKSSMAKIKGQKTRSASNEGAKDRRGQKTWAKNRRSIRLGPEYDIGLTTMFTR